MPCHDSTGPLGDPSWGCGQPHGLGATFRRRFRDCRCAVYTRRSSTPLVLDRDDEKKILEARLKEIEQEKEAIEKRIKELQ